MDLHAAPIHMCMHALDTLVKGFGHSQRQQAVQALSHAFAYHALDPLQLINGIVSDVRRRRKLTTSILPGTLPSFHTASKGL